MEGVNKENPTDLDIRLISLKNYYISLKKKKDMKKNIEAYFDFLVEKKKEAAAHFANLYVQKTYPNAVAFMARECPVLAMSIIMYIKTIK
jgi:hypothetical protein